MLFMRRQNKKIKKKRYAEKKKDCSPRLVDDNLVLNDADAKSKFQPFSYGFSILNPSPKPSLQERLFLFWAMPIQF